MRWVFDPKTFTRDRENAAKPFFASFWTIFPKKNLESAVEEKKMLEDGSELLEKAKRHQNWICYFWKGQMLPQTPLEMELGDFEKRKTTSKG